VSSARRTASPTPVHERDHIASELGGIAGEQPKVPRFGTLPRGYRGRPARRGFYKWKAQYGGLQVSEARRLQVLEAENARLKKLLADAMLDNAMLKDVASKKW
jgi:putative transposase